MYKQLNILLVNDPVKSHSMLTDSLIDEGFFITATISCQDNLVSSIQQHNPDVVVIDMETPDDMIFEQLILVNQTFPRPVVFFAESGESDIIKKAVKTGVGAFIVDGQGSRTMRPIIELAIERYLDTLSLRTELSETKQQLEDRKTIERAKGILMKQKNISEDAAYKTIRKIAMQKNKKIIDIAHNVIELSSIFE